MGALRLRSLRSLGAVRGKTEDGRLVRMWKEEVKYNDQRCWVSSVELDVQDRPVPCVLAVHAYSYSSVTAKERCKCKGRCGRQIRRPIEDGLTPWEMLMMRVLMQEDSAANS